MVFKSSLALCFLTLVFALAQSAAQSLSTYPNAIKDRQVRPESPMLPPPRNQVFIDPDFGSSMIRVTDETTNSEFPGDYLQTQGGLANEWSIDTTKFYVQGKGGREFAFSFDPATMSVGSLSNAKAGEGLLLPLRIGSSFSFVDSDLIYGTTSVDPLTITSYRFSTDTSIPIVDTRTCGVQPPLGSGPSVVSDDDVSPSLDDTRLSISEGGSEAGKHMYVVVYDRNLGCRWYNTQTGAIGGQWGTTGLASATTPFLINHAYLSRSGDYVVILVAGYGWYVWDLSTLTVTSCSVSDPLNQCAGYSAVGYNSLVNSPAMTGDMQTAKRSFADISQISELFLPGLSDWGQDHHFTWTNVNSTDTAPVCASTYGYDGNTWIDEPYEGEIFCIETDGVASTVWRFAHNRATYISPYYQTQPLGSVSRDGNFFLFTSNWDAQLGLGTEGTPRADAFIVKLE